MRRRLTAALSAEGSEKDAGVTLIELLTAGMLSVLVLAMVGGFFISTAKVTTTAVQSRTSNTVASTAMQEASTVVRLATQLTVPGSSTPTPAVVSGSASKLVIYSLINVADPTNPAPTRVTLDATSGSLVETRCVGTQTSGVWSFSGCAASTINLGGPVVAPGTGQNPLFTYQNSTGATLALVSGSLPTTALGNVASVTISVNMQAAGSSTTAPPVYITASVGMPNIGLQQVTTP